MSLLGGTSTMAQEVNITDSINMLQNIQVNKRINNTHLANWLLENRKTYNDQSKEINGVLAQYAKYLHQRAKYAEAIIFLNATKRFYFKTKDYYNYLKYNALQASCETFTAAFDTATQRLNNCVELSHKLLNGKEQTEVEARCNITLGIINAMQQNFDDAIKGFKTADSLFKTIDYEFDRLPIAGYIGNIFLLTRQFEKALEYYLKAQELQEKNKDYNSLIATQSNIANAYMALDQYEKALNELKYGREIAEKIGDNLEIITNYTITGDVYMEMGLYDESEKWLLAAYNKHKENQHIYGEMQALKTLTNLYYKMQKAEMAISNAEKLLQLSKQYKSAEHTIEALKFLWKSNDTLKNYNKAYPYLYRYHRVHDSAKLKNFNNELAQLQAQFDLEKKQSDIQLLTAKNDILTLEQKNKTTTNAILLTTSLFFLICAITLFVLIRKIKKSSKKIIEQNTQLAESDHQKDYLLKELHHRVKNNLQVVSSLLNLQRESVQDANTVAALKECKNRVDAMAMIHKHLYKSHHIKAVDIKAYLEHLVLTLAYTYGFKKNFEFKNDISSEPIDVDIAIPIGLIVNELVSNSFKHGFKQNTTASISLELKVEDKLIKLIIGDQGKGFSPDFDLNNHTSFGLELVNTLVNQLNGKVEIIKSNGATFFIEIDKTRSLAA